MRALPIAAFALLPLSAAAVSPAEDGPRAAAEPVTPVPAERDDPMNLYSMQPGCESIPRQVAGEDREYGATRLDRLPPGKLLHSVERRVDGCPVVTFVAEERKRQLSGR